MIETHKEGKFSWEAEIESLRQQLADCRGAIQVLFHTANEKQRQLAEKDAEIDLLKTENRDACIGLSDYFGQQLAEKDAEIERLKEDGNMPVKYYQPNSKGPVCAVYGASSINFADSLLEQLAASQAREQQLREAVRQNQEWHENYDEYGGYPESELAEVNEKALATPADTSALEVMIAKASKVMRERCAVEVAETADMVGIIGHSDRECLQVAIRALTGVTLEDIKNG